MKVIDKLKQAEGQTLFSIEVLPPLKGRTIGELFNVMDPLMDYKPAFVDVTYHSEEVVYKKRPDGLIEEVPLRKRPGTVGICAAVQFKYNVETVPHLVCVGFSKEETEDALFSLYYQGIENVLLLRGDDKSPAHLIKTGVNHYGSELVQQVSNMNKGKFLHDETETDMQTDFCIGVAGYPEKHFQSPNMQHDLKWLKHKVDTGADYIVTQMFFDNKKYFDFVEKCRNIGINVPIIPGIKPLYSKNHLKSLPSNFYIDIPSDLSKEVEKCKTNDDVNLVGVEWAINQCKELKEARVPCLHFYTMSRSKETLEIAKAVF